MSINYNFNKNNQYQAWFKAKHFNLKPSGTKSLPDVILPQPSLTQSSKLVYGYSRVDLDKYIPISIVELILYFYVRKYCIYAVGKNGFGDFGVGHNSKISKFTLLKEFSFLCDDLNDIYVGHNRFIIKNVMNKLHAAGNNTSGNCGISRSLMDDNIDKIVDFTEIKIPTNDFINVVSSGKFSYHSFIITANKTVYAFGQNDEGQFGNGSILEDGFFSKPTTFPLLNLILSNYRITKIECGLSHTLFLTKCGQILSCGENNGALGISNDNDDNILIPTIITQQIAYKIINIAVGSSHNLCLDEKHNLYVFGSNHFGELGIGKNDSFIRKITLNNKLLNKYIIKIRCGCYHSLCIDDIGKCYIWGWNLNGQIGNFKGGKTENVLIPYLFKSNYEIIDGSCSDYHTVLLDFNNDVWTFGDNGSNQCWGKPYSNVLDTYAPYKLDRKLDIGIDDNTTIESVIAQNQSTFIITNV